MRCGLYGKLPARRDFVAVSAPQDFMAVWEPWIESAVSASRATLAGAWKDVFLRAPIWRFWLGPALAGRAVAGAFMSSMDGVGRYFPLTAFALEDGHARIAPPHLDAQDRFYEALEDFLLATLEPAITFDDVKARLDGLPVPAPREDILPTGVHRVAGGALAARLGTGPASGALSVLAGAEPAATHAHSSVWWTAGGEDYPPLGLFAVKMPDPYLMTGMLTGRFGARE
jgi:type VI secretion system protein ImpM